jgi:NADPH:quinone reductase-like Zn-dependent oxidoreductase
MVISWFVDEELKFFLSHASGEDLRTIAGLLESGKLRSVIDRRYPLAEAADAMRYLEAGRARGKVIITIGG